VVAVGGAALIVGALAFHPADPPSSTAENRSALPSAPESEPVELPARTRPARATASPAPSMAELRTRLDQDVVLSADPAGGVRITFVRQSSVAGARGFRENDVLRKVDAADILTVDQARDAIIEAIEMRRAHEFQLERTGRTLVLRFKAKSG
jgi:hypothetical protein